MIIQSLNDYYSRKVAEDSINLAPFGFEHKEIPFVILLDGSGEFSGIEDTREGEGKKKTARKFTVPQSCKRTGSNSWQTAFLLWDHPGYVLGYSEEKPEMAKKQHGSFIGLIKKLFPEPVADVGVRAVLRFLERGDFTKLYVDELWEEIKTGKGNLAFRLVNEQQLICQRPAVMQVWANHIAAADSEIGICLVSGEKERISRLHPAIKGVWGAQTSGANIVSFNLAAFNSFSKTQGYNAPISELVSFNYTTALNYLLRKGSRQRMQVGDASTVFWSGKKHVVEDDFADIWGDNAKDNPDGYTAAIKRLFSSPWFGLKPVDDDTQFFVLGLAPNASRISIRFWHIDTVSGIGKKLYQYFDDINIGPTPRGLDYQSLHELLRCVAILGKSENIPPNLGGEVMRSILEGTPFPWTWLQAAVNRIRAEQSVTHARASVIKAVLNRYWRSKEIKPFEKELEVSLDESNTDPGYLMGRLFAVLERIQSLAQPNINATIRDRFYGAASATPATVFPILLKLKNHHLKKLDNKGFTVNSEKLIGSIMDILPQNKMPKSLRLEEQGMFAIGYYQQFQAFFHKPEQTVTEGESK